MHSSNGSHICTAEGRIQPRYQHLRGEGSPYGKATGLESTQESVPPQKETPQEKVPRSHFSHFSGASARERKSKGKAQMVHTQRIVQCCALYMSTSLCMHGCILLSGRDVAKVSTLELLTTAPSDPVHSHAPVIRQH